MEKAELSGAVFEHFETFVEVNCDWGFDGIDALKGDLDLSI